MSLGCSTEPWRPLGAGSGVCHRSRPFHTKHPVGKTHNFYTARSHWSRRPFEVLFAGHLQAFLITGSLRGASLPPSFCLPALGGEGVSLHGQFISRLESPLPNTRARARSRRSVPALGCPAAGILATLGKPLRRTVLQQ